nr:cysteine-rich PDZ-binding protein [Ipomoea batatas]
MHASRERYLRARQHRPRRAFTSINFCPISIGSVKPWLLQVTVFWFTFDSEIHCCTKMVCEKCEKKLGKVIVPDKWKEGAHNTTEGGGRKINENKLLSKKNRWTPYGNTKCIICKQQVHQDAKYCHTCAYSKGVCAMCGKQVLDTKLYKQSNV